MEGISKKIYMELSEPTQEDSRSDQVRILDELKAWGIEGKISYQAMRQLYPVCEHSGWKFTASLAFNGNMWEVTALEEGNTSDRHYGFAIDLGSTTVVVSLVDCNTGKCVEKASTFNRQITYGTDILTRIFHCKDKPDQLEAVRQATIDSICHTMKILEKKTGIPAASCIQAVIAGNTTMIHFLLGMDPFCVFHTPYAVRADRPGYIKGCELSLPVNGYVYIFPAKSNYLGGDIISGMVATEIYKQDKICVFFDIGTNGELVMGNKEFLLCGAGAAGPALEGGVVKTGMRAEDGAVETVKLEQGEFKLGVIGGGAPKGICGSGIVDMIAELFLNGWINIQGKFVPEKSPKIRKMEEEWAVEYAPDLYFYQEDIDEFLKTKSAAYTMVEIMMKETGITMEDIDKFYVAGAFGRHVSKESAITIGMYPDMERDRIINAGNTSLLGAEKALTDKEVLDDIEGILDHMTYIQFGAVDDFLQMMVAARAIPHTHMERFPSVMAKLKGEIYESHSTH
ncbi:MAG: ASKHA domain-containing protein [Blautia sp.]|nr:ASKHA domain-containing protein [Clostridia bacterium]MDY4694312.1 ASKHA domain-containing protein [Blautia sp.]MDY5555896.1 ASKHA domain-containing protein [Blautia sp.]